MSTCSGGDSDSRFVDVDGMQVRYKRIGHGCPVVLLHGSTSSLDNPQRVTAAGLINASGYPEKSLPAGMQLARNPLLRPVLRRWMPRKAVQRSLSQAVGLQSGIVDDAMVDRVHRLWNRPGHRSAFVDFANTRQPHRSAGIRRISVPTLMLRSAGMDGQHFARDIANSRELVHPHGGHLLHEEDPAWVADAIADFLDDVAGAGR